MPITSLHLDTPQDLGAPRGRKLPADESSVRENCRFIPVATQAVGVGDHPAEALGKNVSRKGCSNPAGRNASEP